MTAANEPTARAIHLQILVSFSAGPLPESVAAALSRKLAPTVVTAIQRSMRRTDWESVDPRITDDVTIPMEIQLQSSVLGTP